MINTIRNRENLWVDLEKKDWVTKLDPLLKPGGGYVLRPEDGAFVHRFPTLAHNAPWVYVQPDRRLRCDIYHRVFFPILNHVHSVCRECWKVVVRPRTVVELFDLYELQCRIGVPCKCGMEVRDTVHGRYGGYFYSRGKKEGLERYAMVRELVDEKISPDVPVILKRYCTEYEIGPDSLGPSDEMPDITPEEREWELEVEALFPPMGYGTKQPEWVSRKVMRDWIMHAYSTGDETYKTFTGGHPLFPPYVTYHPEDGGKEDGCDSGCCV